MRDEILYSNLLGLIKMGKWHLSVEESKALLSIENELRVRLNKCQGPQPVSNPIKKVKRGNK